MTRQDPGAATGAGVYPTEPRCGRQGCGHSAAFHALGRRAGMASQWIRTACSNSGCECSRYVPGEPEPERCRCCGAPWNPIEAARKEARGG